MLREVVWFFVIFCSIPAFSAETQLRLYRPLTETTNHLPMVITEKKSGECWQQSQLIKREDAWRCMAEGKVYDPCFVRPFGSHLTTNCLASPWSRDAIEITVATPLDNRHHEVLDMSRTFPWALELIHGEKCLSVESSEQYDGLPVHYRCEGNKELVGDIQRCNSMWKILQHGSTSAETLDILRAWF